MQTFNLLQNHPIIIILEQKANQRKEERFLSLTSSSHPTMASLTGQSFFEFHQQGKDGASEGGQN